MHSKILYLLKKLICIIIFLFIYNAVISQNYMGYNMKDVIMIKGNNYEIKKSSGLFNTILIYEIPLDVILLGEHTKGKKIESFGFDTTNTVVHYFRFDQTEDEGEVMKIVQANNLDYKRVDVGDKQNFFQWIDQQHRYNFILNVIPMDKVFVISYEITKE